MFNALFFIAIFLALADWLATALRKKRLRWFTKGAALLALIAWFSVLGGWQNRLAWFGLGLACGLIGDIALQLPPRFFLAGLAAFLAGHLCYVFGFLAYGLRVNAGSWVFGAILIGTNAVVFSRLLRAMSRRPGNGAMRPPVIAYGLVISLMSLCAGLTLFNPAWLTLAAICCWVGAELFVASDTLIAYRQFTSPRKNSDLTIMVTYHLAQFLITAGALLNQV
jgi:alkenylglycerophosphocholine hydrolase